MVLRDPERRWDRQEEIVRKVMMLIGIGMAAGYFIGFNDAAAHERNVVHRLVDRVRGDMDGKVGNDVDAVMDRLEKK
jgi:hypothetical protein